MTTMASKDPRLVSLHILSFEMRTNSLRSSSLDMALIMMTTAFSANSSTTGQRKVITTLEGLAETLEITSLLPIRCLAINKSLKEDLVRTRVI